MPVQISIDNDFSKGLITQATGLNFPAGACTETYNCEFDFVGGVRRRFGFDFERNFSTKNINRSNQAVSTYLWKNVAGNGDVTVLVKQVGATLYFYETAITGNYSNGAVASTVTLTAVSGSTATDVSVIEAQYSDGNGLLFVTHPFCDPMRIAYDTSAHTASATSITIQIRDFLGAAADPYAVSERPTATLSGLNVSHKYNLLNQGWTTANLTAWDTAQTTMPSNADVMWDFSTTNVAGDEDFDASSAAIARVTAGNTPAPRGHFILTLSNQDRDTAAGTSGVAATSMGIQRPSTSAFFAGRVFYSGINYVGANTNIYFTQIIENPTQYGACYQANDPSSQDLFSLLPSDGGVISIHDAGTVIKLIPIPGGICVFAHRGVWYITGSTGIGFEATDYTVQKIATVETLSATSFVNTQSYSMGGPAAGGKSNYIAWWNGEGIYSMSVSVNSLGIQSMPVIESLTDHTIRDFYAEIPLTSKRFARGVYHPLDGHVRWIFKSVSTSQITETYEFDRVLSYNTITGAFYPWIISASNVKVNSIIATDLLAKAVQVNHVVDASSNNVIDASGNNVIAFGEVVTEDPNFDKYLVSYINGTTYSFTFADKINASFVDWFEFDDLGVDYTSYLITGERIKGDAIRKFQNNWIRIYSNITDSISYYFQGIWDYATTGSGTGRWSTKQYVHKDDTTHSVFSKRLKVRGHGLVLQFKITSVPGQPFDIIGWSAVQTSNPAP